MKLKAVRNSSLAGLAAFFMISTLIQGQPKRSHYNSIVDTIIMVGCFWCIEPIMESLDGVMNVTSGYAGGPAKLQHTRVFAQEKQVMLKSCKLLMTKPGSL